MPVPKPGMVIANGGCIHIQFPNFQVEMSCDNDTELESCIEMLKTGLKIFETEKAKRILMREVDDKEGGQLAGMQPSVLSSPRPMPPSYTLAAGNTTSAGKP